MDKGLLLFVSTLHAVGKSIKVNRKKPHITLKNKGHVEKVWGKVHRAEIFIPLLVHHQNQWMGGVDITDQRTTIMLCTYITMDPRKMLTSCLLFLSFKTWLTKTLHCQHKNLQGSQAHQDFI
eukprot:7291262-Ditylum_brightwellii.AAC.1